MAIKFQHLNKPAPGQFDKKDFVGCLPKTAPIWSFKKIGDINVEKDLSIFWIIDNYHRYSVIPKLTIYSKQIKMLCWKAGNLFSEKPIILYL